NERGAAEHLSRLAVPPPLRERTRVQAGQVDRSHRVRRGLQAPGCRPGRVQRGPRVLLMARPYLTAALQSFDVLECMREITAADVADQLPGIQPICRLTRSETACWRTMKQKPTGSVGAPT